MVPHGPFIVTAMLLILGGTPTEAAPAELDNSRGVSPWKARLEESPMKKQSILLVSATVIISTGMALAQAQTPQQYEKSGAPSGLQSKTPDKPPVVTLPEANAPAPDGSGAPASVTTDRTANFEDRWSAQSGVPYLPPNPTVPNTTAPAPETTGQAAKFEDRWSGQAGVPYLPPNAAVPNATAPLPETTGQAPNVSKKMGAEVESAGDQRASPDEH